MGSCVYNPNPREVEIGKSLGFQAGQPRLFSKLQASEQLCQENKKIEVPGK